MAVETALGQLGRSNHQLDACLSCGVSNCVVHPNLRAAPHPALLNADSHSLSLRRGLCSCVSGQFPGDTDAAGSNSVLKSKRTSEGGRRNFCGLTDKGELSVWEVFGFSCLLL